MRGEQYTCAKCGQIYFTRYTTAASVALYDLNLSYDDDEEDQLDELLIVTQDEYDEDEYSASTDLNTEENEEGATAPALLYLD